MNNKILITINVPLLSKSYDIFIPINKKIGTIKKYCIDVINELSNNSLVDTDKLNLYDKDGCIQNVSYKEYVCNMDYIAGISTAYLISFKNRL